MSQPRIAGWLIPYSAEAQPIQRPHDFIRAEGGVFDGRMQRRHELYLGDLRRTALETLKTFIRRPFSRQTQCRVGATNDEKGEPTPSQLAPHLILAPDASTP